MRNSSGEPCVIRLRLLPELGLTGSEIVFDLVNDRSREVRTGEGKSSGAIGLKMFPGETTLLAVGSCRDVALGFLRQARDYWGDVMRVETYPNKAQVATSLARLMAMIGRGEKAVKAQEAVEKMREFWDLRIPPQAHAARLIEKAASALQGIEVRARVEEKEGTLLHVVLSGLPREQIARLEWKLATPDGWKAELVDDAPRSRASWRLTRVPSKREAKGAHASTFHIQARVQTTDTHLHLVDKKIVGLVSFVRGEQKQVLVSDDLEGKTALKDWCWRDGGSDLAARLPNTGFMAQAARGGKRGFRIADKSPTASIGVRSPFFRQFEPGDYVKASAHVSQAQSEGVSLYLQCWRNPKGPNHYTMVKTETCEEKEGWERVTIETPIPAGTTAVTFEVYSPTSCQGVFDFDDVELVLFGSRPNISWLGAE